MADKFSRRDYPSIPPELWDYYDLVKQKCPSHRLVEKCKSQGESRTWKGINDTLQLASGSTALSPIALLKRVGFNKNDLDPNNFQASLGVVRAINLLYQLDFRNIRPLPVRTSRRETDLLATRKSELYAVEVFRSHEDANRFIDAVGYIARRYEEKRTQLNSTMTAHKCDRALLVNVMDSPLKFLTNTDELQDVIEQSYAKIVNPDTTHHLMLFTGMSSIKGGDEHVIYPPLP